MKKSYYMSNINKKNLGISNYFIMVIRSSLNNPRKDDKEWMLSKEMSI